MAEWPTVFAMDAIKGRNTNTKYQIHGENTAKTFSRIPLKIGERGSKW